MITLYFPPNKEKGKEEREKHRGKREGEKVEGGRKGGGRK
jgi:hypothetical protein